MGISGFIEVVGLTLWGYELFSNMRAGKKLLKDSRALNLITPTQQTQGVLN
jgi:hypothetical protein